MVPSTSGDDDFASFLEAELISASDDIADLERFKRRKIEVLESTRLSQSIPSHGEEDAEVSGATPEKDKCRHPGSKGGLCYKCGKETSDESGVAVAYIHKDFRLTNEEIARLRESDLKNLFRQRKLYLVLDLDHTLLNSSRLSDITEEEVYLRGSQENLPDALKGSLYKLDSMHMMTKLRPFVHTFLKEASKLFEMHIYTMGERAYALEMAKLLDPGNVYFHSKVIAQEDCTNRHKKGLDVFLGEESAVLILDDTEAVWDKHKDRLILMERYNFFASSCRQFGSSCKSLSQVRSDESETDGALATTLRVLQRIHRIFFDPERKESLVDRDVSQVLKTVKAEVLKGCKVVFSRVSPLSFEHCGR